MTVEEQMRTQLSASLRERDQASSIEILSLQSQNEERIRQLMTESVRLVDEREGMRGLLLKHGEIVDSLHTP